MEPKELSDFDKGQVVVARELGLSVSQTAKMVGCSRAAVVSAYRQWYEEGLRLRAGRPKLIDPKELDDESGSESDEAVEDNPEPKASSGERTGDGERPGETSADRTEEEEEEEEQPGGAAGPSCDLQD